jgi:hypothetical protein
LPDPSLIVEGKHLRQPSKRAQKANDPVLAVIDEEKTDGENDIVEVGGVSGSINEKKSDTEFILNDSPSPISDTISVKSTSSEFRNEIFESMEGRKDGIAPLSAPTEIKGQKEDGLSELKKGISFHLFTRI